VGIGHRGFHLNEQNGGITQERLMEKINELRNDFKINGILLQLPLPKEYDLDIEEALNAIGSAKDVDGLHDLNIELLNKIGISSDCGKEDSGFVPCTPLGAMHILKQIMTDNQNQGK
jgi:methylenetetrahydrofolate dehydrogenase (NADP+)/methenyltetrahydrofolate cyclohydrolase